MSNVIDSIQLSGVTYGIKGSGGTETIELTQAEYDALTPKDPNTYYIITDAQAGDLTNYYTKTETNTLLGGKADTATTYTKTEVDNAITAGTSTKQDTLVSGTNIKTINNTSILGSGNIDIQGGGGKAIEAGRGISITTGETADTVSFNLPISADTDGSVNKLLVGARNTSQYTNSNIVIGDDNYTYGHNGSRVYTGATIIGYNNRVGCIGRQTNDTIRSFAIGKGNKINGGNTYIIGVDNNFEDINSAKKNYTYVFGRANIGNSIFSDSQNIFVFGAYNKVTKSDEFALGEYNVSSNDGTTSGNTFFSIGNGTADNARHNAFEIRQNGDIYLSSGGTDIKLQDHLGGSVNVVQTTGTSTTDVMSQNAATSNFIYDINLNYKLNGRDTLALQSKGKNLFIPYMTINGEKVLSTNDLSVIETSAITTSISSSSTDAQVPSAKAVYDIVGDIETLLSQI